jgi:hypothetical protein
MSAQPKTIEAVSKPKTVWQLIADVQAELASKGIGKNQTNTFDKYQFRGIDDVYNALGPILARHGLVVIPQVTAREITERQSQKGGALFHVVMDVTYRFVSAGDGSEALVPVVGEAMDRGDKAINKAMSAAYKLAAFQVFCIPVAGQDSEQESHVVAKRSTSVAAAVIETGGAKFDEGLRDELVEAIDQCFVDDPETGLVCVDEVSLDMVLDRLRKDAELKIGAWTKLPSKVRTFIKRREAA